MTTNTPGDPEIVQGADLAAGIIAARFAADTDRMLELLTAASPNQLAHAVSYLASLYQNAITVLADHHGRDASRLHHETMRAWRDGQDPRVRPKTNMTMFKRPPQPT